MKNIPRDDSGGGMKVHWNPIIITDKSTLYMRTFVV